MPTLRTLASTLIEQQALIGTRNTLHVDPDRQQYIRCLNDGRFNVLDSITNFSFSIKLTVDDFYASQNARVGLISTLNYPGNVYGVAAFINQGHELQLYYAQNANGTNNLKILRYALGNANLTGQLMQLTISQDITRKQWVSGQWVVVPTVYLNNRILSVDLITSSVTGAYNDTLTCLNNQPYVEVGRIAIQSAAHEDYTKGSVSDLLLVDIPVGEHHNYSLLQGHVPEAVHANVVAYVSCNQDRGLVAYDTVEHFNYARQSPVRCAHWELVNYTSDEAGVTNPQHQSAWYNLYTHQPETVHVTRKALRFDAGANHYLTVADFVPTKEKGFTVIMGFALDTDRTFQTNHSDCLLSKRDSANGKYKIVAGVPNTTSAYAFVSVPSGYGGLFYADLKTDISKPCMLIFEECAHVGSANPFYSYYDNRRSFCNGYLSAYDRNGNNLSSGFDEIDGELYIGCDDLQTITTRYFNGYLFYVGIWKGMLSPLQIHTLVNKGFPRNPTADELTDCELFIDFNSAYNDGGVLKLVDLSPKGRTVVMNNYTAMDIDGGGKVVDVEGLR